MTAPSFLDSGTLVDATSGTTIGPVPLPAGASSGDFAILSVISHGNTTLSTPTGWNAFTGGVQANANLSSGFFWRRLDGTTGDNVPTVTSSASFSTTNSAGARIRTYSGVVASGTPFDESVGSGPTEDDTPRSAAVTTAGIDRLIVSMVGMANDAVVVDGDWSTLPAAGWTLDGVVDNWNYDGDGTLLSVSKTQATTATVAAADVGTYISTVTFWRSFTVALIPEPTTASIVDFDQVANWFTDNDGASIAVDYVADDILVYFAVIENGNSAGTQDVGPPTGANVTFTEGPHGGAGVSGASPTGIWYGQATGPGSSVTHNATVVTPSLGYNGAAVLVIRGGTLTGLQEFGDTPSASSPYSITTPAGAVVVVGLGEWNATSGFTGTAGSGTHAERVDTDDGSHYGIWLGTWEGTDAATDDFGITNYSGTLARQVGLVIPAQGPPSSAPTDPTSVVATEADSEATVTWVDGSGTPEPTWDVEYRVDGGSWTTSASDIAQGVQTRTQTGLTNGTTVRFRVRGQNTAGDSAWVESNDVTVGAIPLEILNATSSGSNTAGNPRNVAYPAHSVGDLIVQSIAIDANVTATVPTTGPNGETITAITTNVNPGAAGPRFSAWWWIATGAEAAGNISVTLSAAEQTSSEAFRVPAGSFDPADPIPDISAAGTQTSGTGTTITMPSFTATVAGGLVVAMGGVDADPMDATFSPAGWTDVITHDVGAVSSFVAQRTALTTTSESISAAVFGINTGDTAAVVGFVIAPAPVDTSVDETVTPVGGVVVGGSVTPTSSFSPPVSGGVVLGGSVSPTSGATHEPAGGIVAGGAVSPVAQWGRTPSGGVLVGGTAAYETALAATAVSTRTGGITQTAAVINCEMTGAPSSLKVSTSSDLSSPVVTVTGTQYASTDWWSFSITGLTAGTHYYAGFGSTPISEFDTAPVGAESYLTMAGSCFQETSTIAFSRMQARKVAAGLPTQFLALGDWPYIDNTTQSVTPYLNAWSGLYSTSAVNTLLYDAAISYTPSDHDWGDNNSHGGAATADEFHTAYRAVHPSYPLPDAANTYHTWVRGRVRWIMLDVMSNRGNEATGSNATRPMLGATQLAWLIDLIGNATEPAIVINVSEPWVIDGESNGWDLAQGEREDIANAIQSAGADRFVLIHGDAHMLAWDDGSNSNYATTPVGNGPPVFCFAPLDNTNSVKGGPYSEGTWSSNQRQYGVIEVADDGSTLTLTIEGYSVTSSTTETQRFTTTIDFTPATSEVVTPVGGVLVGGSAPVAVALASSGGVLVNGSAVPGLSLVSLVSGGVVSGGVVSPQIEISRTPAGGVVLDGSITSANSHVHVPAGGLRLDGIATPTLVLSRPASGGVVAGGSVSPTSGATHEPTGGIASGGAITRLIELSRTPFGGALAAGSAQPAIELVRAPAGGVVSGGTVSPQIAISRTPTGGAQLGGSVTSVDSDVHQPSGGVVLGGSVLPAISVVRAPLGGVRAGGSVIPGAAGFYSPSGGVVSGGTVSPQIAISRTPVGGVAVGGSVTSIDSDVHEPSGGVLLGGSVLPSIDLVRSPSGGVLAGGSVTPQSNGTFTPTGGVVSGGTVSPQIAISRTPTGGAQLGGSVVPATASSWVPSGGIVLGGTVTPVTGGTVTPVGGVIAGGTVVPVLVLVRIPGGGLTLSSSAARTMSIRRSPAGGAVAGGAVTPVAGNSIQADGGVTVGGNASPSIQMARQPSGGAAVGGTLVQQVRLVRVPVGGALFGGAVAADTGYSSDLLMVDLAIPVLQVDFVVLDQLNVSL